MRKRDVIKKIKEIYKNGINDIINDIEYVLSENGYWYHDPDCINGRIFKKYDYNADQLVVDGVNDTLTTDWIHTKKEIIKNNGIINV